MSQLTFRNERNQRRVGNLLLTAMEGVNSYLRGELLQYPQIQLDLLKCYYLRLLNKVFHAIHAKGLDL